MASFSRNAAATEAATEASSTAQMAAHHREPSPAARVTWRTARHTAIAAHRAAGGMVIAATHIALDLGPGDATLDPGAFTWSLSALDEALL